MLAKVKSFGLIGIDAYPVEIEVDVTAGLPSVTIVGLPDSSIKESKDRVRSSIKNSDFIHPPDKITINLAPGDIKKEGPAFDLPIALGILAASQQINKEILEKYFFVGELSLNGDIRPIKGALAMALNLRKRRVRNLVLPLENINEAAIVKEIKPFGAKTLRELVLALYEPSSFTPKKPIFRKKIISSNHELDFIDVKGQASGKRALEIAASGRHNILLIGPPGSGKTMLSKRLTTILPQMSIDEALETTKIHSAAGLTNTSQGLIIERPFRAPHHTISDIALVGGGSIPQPGEISFAHNGILFLDELPEFHRNALEVLRQPLEDGFIRVSRASRSLSFPANFMLIAAMNPCPCGHFGQIRPACRCTPRQVHRYRSKISGPLLDRIDIHMEIPALKYHELTTDEKVEDSAAIKERIMKAHAIQKERFSSDGNIFNAQISHRQIKKYCPLGKDSSALLKDAMENLHLSTRAYTKVLKVARTIADLEGKEAIHTQHVAEAIQYRSLDRESF